MVIIIIIDHGHHDYHVHHDLPQNQNKEEDYDEYGHHNHPLANKKVEEYCGHHYCP